MKSIYTIREDTCAKKILFCTEIDDEDFVDDPIFMTPGRNDSVQFGDMILNFSVPVVIDIDQKIIEDFSATYLIDIGGGLYTQIVADLIERGVDCDSAEDIASSVDGENITVSVKISPKNIVTHVGRIGRR